MAKQKDKKEYLWHHREAEECLRRAGSRREGLTEEEAGSRLESVGKNILREEEGISVFRLLLRQLESPLIYLLAGAAAVSVIPGHYTDAIVILAVIVINTALGFFQEYKAEEALASLKRLAAPRGISSLSRPGTVFRRTPG